MNNTLEDALGARWLGACNTWRADKESVNIVIEDGRHDCRAIWCRYVRLESNAASSPERTLRSWGVPIVIIGSLSQTSRWLSGHGDVVWPSRARPHRACRTTMAASPALGLTSKHPEYLNLIFFQTGGTCRTRLARKPAIASMYFGMYYKIFVLYFKFTFIATWNKWVFKDIAIALVVIFKHFFIIYYNYYLLIILLIKLN